MNTITIEHADNKVTDAVKQLMEILGLPIKITPEGWAPVEGTITNPEVLDAINRYEKGESTLTPFNNELKQQLLERGKV